MWFTVNIITNDCEWKKQQMTLSLVDFLICPNDKYMKKKKWIFKLTGKGNDKFFSFLGKKFIKEG